MPRLLLAVLAAVLAGCTTSYSLTLMPRDSGQIYYGEAVARPGADTQVTITIGERTYRGDWVVAQPPPAAGVLIGGMFGSRRSGVGTSVVIDQQAGTEAKALLRSAEGAGLRCDLKGVHSNSGSGSCQDDRGLVYDVQIRAKGS